MCSTARRIVRLCKPSVWVRRLLRTARTEGKNNGDKIDCILLAAHEEQVYAEDYAGCHHCADTCGDSLLRDFRLERSAADCTLCSNLCAQRIYLPQGHERENTISDLSAVVTGILLAFNLPPTIHPLIAVFGGVVAVVVVKQMFSGIEAEFCQSRIDGKNYSDEFVPFKDEYLGLSSFYYLGSSDAMTTAQTAEPVGTGDRRTSSPAT